MFFRFLKHNKAYKNYIDELSKDKAISLMLATDISASYCLGSWVYGVASSGTFIKNAVMTSLPIGLLIMAII